MISRHFSTILTYLVYIYKENWTYFVSAIVLKLIEILAKCARVYRGVIYPNICTKYFDVNDLESTRSCTIWSTVRYKQSQLKMFICSGVTLYGEIKAKSRGPEPQGAPAKWTNFLVYFLLIHPILLLLLCLSLVDYKSISCARVLC